MDSPCRRQSSCTSQSAASVKFFDNQRGQHAENNKGNHHRQNDDSVIQNQPKHQVIHASAGPWVPCFPSYTGTPCYPARVFVRLLGSIFRHLPGPVRRRVVRLGQKRFTVTAGAFVFDEAGRILLLEHEFRADSRWGLPGGFLDKAEQPEAGLRRELREEVSLEVDDVEIYFVRTLKRPSQVEMYFACKAVSAATPSSFEIRKAQWFDTNDLPDELSNDQRKMIKRALDVREKRRG